MPNPVSWLCTVVPNLWTAVGMTRPSPVHKSVLRRSGLWKAPGRYGPAVIKLVFCLTRKDGMSREEFQRYWRESHAPLVASHAETLNIRRYHQLHTVDDAINDPIRASRGGPPSYDGVAELWWRSEGTWRSASLNPMAREANRLLLEDEAKFIDLKNSPLWLNREEMIYGELVKPS